MDYRISFVVSVMAQYRSVHCHKVDRQARTMTKQKCRCTAIQRHFLVRLTGFEPAAFRGRSRTIYPAELQPHIYENRRWDEIHRMKFCERLE